MGARANRLAAELRDEVACALVANAGHAFDVVDRVAGEREHVDHLLRRHAELLGDAGRAMLDGLSLIHHDASHHGKDETKIEQLAIIEETQLKIFSRFLASMQQVREGDGTLFDHTAILNASNLGNASAHTCDNLPIILAGGGFKHQGHVLKDRKDNMPLSNLYVRMLQQIGVETDAFGSSTGVVGDV